MDRLVPIPLGGQSNSLDTPSEVLGCLRWLGEFQILACIPLAGSVPIKDVADLSGVPKTLLARIIRLMATSGFLHELQPDYVAHTPLSAQFVTNPALLDAAMFLAESVAPAALSMALATQRFGDSQRSDESAYNLALNTNKPFHTARDERPKLSRQWSAYLHYAGGLHAASENVADIFAQLNWDSPNISIAYTRIVEVGAQSTTMARKLADLYSNFHILVQISDPKPASAAALLLLKQNRLDTSSNYTDHGPDLNPRVTVTNRAVGTRQTATDAAIYILHLPLASSSPLTSAGANGTLSELQAHLSVLRSNNGLLLVLTARLLPKPGTLPNPEIEAIARSRSLTLRQLANENEMEMLELLELIDAVRDSMGRLVVVNKLCSRNNLVVALVVKYQVYGDADDIMEL
ncbi:MAG: hypothetical protein Q9157_002139 [Trypethelium eluteriae]